MITFRKSIVLIALLIGTLSIHGQVNFKEGWILTAENDTVHGLINDAGGMRNSRVCLFKESKKSETIKYSPEDIHSYMFTGEKYYVSRWISHNSRNINSFLEVILMGKVSLYRYNIAGVYYIKKEGQELMPLINEVDPVEKSRYIYPIKWDSYKLGTTVYKDTLYSVFEDCVPVLNELDLVEYNRKSLLNTTKKYIRLTSQEEGNITYERSVKLAKPKIGVYSGVQMSKVLFYDYLIDSELTTSVPFGIFYNVPLSQLSENFSVQVEATLSSINYGNNFINLTSGYDEFALKSISIGIPISFNYGLNFNRFSPFIAVGKETAFVITSNVSYMGQRFDETGVIKYGEIENTLHKVQKGGWFADLGLKYKINQDFTIFTSLRYQHYFNLIIEDPSVSNNTYATAVGFWDTTQYETYLLSLRLGVMF